MTVRRMSGRTRRPHDGEALLVHSLHIGELEELEFGLSLSADRPGVLLALLREAELDELRAPEGLEEGRLEGLLLGLVAQVFDPSLDLVGCFY